MNREELNAWLDVAQRRALTPQEWRRLEETLERDPSQREDLADEVRLTRLLQDLADAPLSPGFTRNVLRAVSEPVRSPAAGWQSAWVGLRRRGLQFGAAAALVVALAVVYSHYHSVSRARMATSLVNLSRGVEAASRATEMPTAEVLLDFEPIHYLSQVTPLADEELLNALQ